MQSWNTFQFVSAVADHYMCLRLQGTTVENICYELRYLPDTRSLAKDHALLLLCDLSHSNPDAVEVAIVSERSKLGFSFNKTASFQLRSTVIGGHHFRCLEH